MELNFKNCLGCYQALDPHSIATNYHKRCSKKLFGTDTPPHVDFGFDQLEELAKTALSRHLGITGVQPKITVDLQKQQSDPTRRLLITGLWGTFILKPPTPRFPDMSVVEDATMHMAQAAQIRTATHGLIQLKSGELAYITRRFDRIKHRDKIKKIAVEDFCQLSGLLTEGKYKTSMERAGKIILRYSSNPGLDAVAFFDITLFSFLTGNADMHLKNFSLIVSENGEVGLAPAYDLIATRLMPIDDFEDSALTVNGKKTKLTRKDFEKLGEALKISNKVIENCFKRIQQAIPQMLTINQASFMSPALKIRYADLIATRASRLGLN